jgi:hypothetical protein
MGKIYFYVLSAFLFLIMLSLFLCCCYFSRRYLASMSDCFACQNCAYFVHGVLKAKEDVADCVAEAKSGTKSDSKEHLIEMAEIDEETTARRQLQILEQRLASGSSNVVLGGRAVGSVSDLLSALGPDPVPIGDPEASPSSSSVTSITTTATTAAIIEPSTTPAAASVPREGE